MDRIIFKISLALSLVALLGIAAACQSDDGSDLEGGNGIENISELCGSYYFSNDWWENIYENGEVNNEAWYGLYRNIIHSAINLEGENVYIRNTGKFQRGQIDPDPGYTYRFSNDFGSAIAIPRFLDNGDLDKRWNLCYLIFDGLVKQHLEKWPIYYMKFPILYEDGNPYFENCPHGEKIFFTSMDRQQLSIKEINETPDCTIIHYNIYRVGDPIDFHGISEGIFESYADTKEYYHYILDHLTNYYPNPFEFSIIEYEQLLQCGWIGTPPNPDEVQYWTIDIPQIRREIDEYITAHTSEAE